MKTYFERQKFSKWIILGLFILTIILLYFTIKTYGTSTFLNILLLGFLPSFLIFILFVIANLVTRIDEFGISIKFFPFHLRYHDYKWSDIKICETKTYKPIKEYGGWGIRYGSKGKAYNVRGNKGIHIQLKNGERILIGTQNPSKAKEILSNYIEIKL